MNSAPVASERAGLIGQALEKLFVSASVQREPSPYFYQTNVFPEMVYNDLLANLPPDDAYGSMKGRTTNKRALNSRLTLSFKPDNLQDLPLEFRSFWNDAAQSFMHPSFPSLATRVYQSLLQEQRPDLLHPGVQVQGKWELLRDFQSYGIGPHADHPDKILTLLFYLSDGPETEALGTSLYRPKQEGFTCDKGLHHPYEDFERVVTVPYQPNAVFGFLRTDVGFHGVEVLEQPNITRNVMRYALWKTS